MIEVKISGAGAGKTYGLSEKLINCSNNFPDKIIYAITYTNSAKRKISNIINERLGYIPNNIIIETVHSFLLNEIIFPYSKFILSDYYNKAVSFKLPDENRYKNARKTQLRAKNIIHNEDVFNVSKRLIDKTNTLHSNKVKKQKVELIINHISCKISHIFIDEAQDLDLDALKVFEILGKNNIDIHVIGDPKQAIKYPTDFENFLKSKIEDGNFNFLEVENLTRRIPNKILEISNLFCPIGQEQKHYEDKEGGIFYLSDDNPEFESILKYYKSEKKLIYIEKKQGNYNTHLQKELYLPIPILERLRSLKEISKHDFDLLIKSIELKIQDDLNYLEPLIIIRTFYKKYGIQYDKSEYAEFISLLNNNKQHSNNDLIVSSIDAVKGLENDICLFILSPTMYQYLMRKIPSGNKHNKIWKKLYVALTRASEKLILVIDSKLFPNHKLNDIKLSLENLNILNIKEVI
ncbi:UvrD-helicase domain-containing protein [Chryseobacterium taihuense]|uniref:DNA 3'-5' helicase II n=1 Tax=Chryseobacterium taihuense TaxID=1141221 RepID=A0ABY0QRM1_9FLAO|nr:UvrD-helicase domain-containing protein [Chryseobacterium taihuense]SDL65020.1 UvrD/REP helicase N-terminal domain-containing protein [Chryseobacterium taihuense]